MTLPRGLIGRVLIAALLSTAIGGLGHWFGLVHQTSAIAFQAAVDWMDLLSDDDTASCMSHPESWSLVRPDAFEIWALHPETLRPYNPAAPSIDSRLRLRHWLGAGPIQFYARGPWGGAQIIETGLPTPCRTMLLQWRRDDDSRSRASLGLLVTQGATTMLAVALTLLIVVGPLLRRVRRLAHAARAVGSDRYHPVPADHGGPLSDLAAVLDQAHVRLARDQEIAAGQRAAIERHLDDVAHDLRTPLTGLQLRLEAASAATGPGTDLRGDLDGALGDVTYLILLVGNLRAASRLREPTPPELKHGDLADVVARVVGRFAFIGHHQQVEVAGAWPDHAVEVSQSEVLVEQALSNLVHNAIVYNRPGGHVGVLLDLRDGRFLLTVTDDGPGVDPALLPRLAERTFRADPTAARDGSGLGIAIAVEVCRRAGWTFALANEEGGGLRVEIAGRSGAQSPYQEL